MKQTQAKTTAAIWQLNPHEAAYLHALPMAVLAVDSKSTIIFMNAAAEALFGSTSESLFTLFDLDEALLARVFNASESISLYEHMLPIRHETLSVNLHMTPVMDARKQVTQALLIIDKLQGLHTQTVSEWKREATHAAGVMGAMLAHEVKNPLSGIRGAAQLLKDEISAAQQPLAELICQETDRIAELLSQVEVFTDGSLVEKSPINIHEVLQYVLQLARAGFAKHVTFIEHYDPSLPDVLAERDRLIQLFLNLVKNAAEATANQESATITLTTRYETGYRIKTKNGENLPLPVVVSVADNGPGIPDAMRNQLFEPFASSKDDGRGLGLAVVAKIAGDLDMMIELGEAEKQGACFNVMLQVVK
jgi:two-component system, NtrC family, nitrogen regulation sensor histidine kinase GlnL